MENSDNELSSDDSDYNPTKHQDIGSEDSAQDFDDEPGTDEGDAQENSSKKRKRTKKAGKAKATTPRIKTESEKSEENLENDPEEEKRKADAIWAEFLETPSEINRPVETSTMKASSSSRDKIIPPKVQTTIQTSKAAELKDSAQLFEFAGETVTIPSKPLNDATSDAPKAATSAVKRPSGGLSSVLSQLSKKNKLSVLEKTKLDWDGFKSTEGINEELQTHNRGRDG